MVATRRIGKGQFSPTKRFPVCPPRTELRGGADCSVKLVKLPCHVCTACVVRSIASQDKKVQRPMACVTLHLANRDLAKKAFLRARATSAIIAQHWRKHWGSTSASVRMPSRRGQNCGVLYRDGGPCHV